MLQLLCLDQPLSFPPFLTVTGHILLECSSNVSCPTRLANAALTLQYTLRLLLQDLLRMRTQGGENSLHLSCAAWILIRELDGSFGLWLHVSFVWACVFCSCLCVWVSRLELGGGYLSHSLWLHFLPYFVNSEQLNPEKIRQFWKTVITYLF